MKNILGDKPHLAIALNSRKGQTKNSDRFLREAVVGLRVAGLPLRDIDPYKLEQSAELTQNQKGLTVPLDQDPFTGKCGEHPTPLNSGEFKPYLEVKSLDKSENGSIVSKKSFNEKQIDSTTIKSSQVIPTNQVIENKPFKPLISKPTSKSTRPQKLPMSQSPLNNQSDLEKFEQMMMRYYDHQGEILRVHEQYLKNQADSSQAFLELMRSQFIGLDTSDASVSSEVNVTSSTKQPINYSNGCLIKHQEITEDEPKITALPSPPEPISDSGSQKLAENEVTPTQKPELEAWTTSFLEVVSDKTGYPVEVLELEMDLEADLGIESIKRVEILGAMQELFPDLPQVNPEDLGEMRTLAQIVEYLDRQSGVDEKKNFDRSLEVFSPSIVGKEIQQKVATLKYLPNPDKLDYTLNTGSICLITDDGTSVSVELATSLVKRGWRVVLLSFPESIVGEKLPLPKAINRVLLVDMSEEHLKQQLNAIANDYGAVGGFIHLNPLRASNNTAKIILKQVFLIAKHLQKSLNTAAKKGRSWFVTVSRLDGELGIGNKTQFNPINGGLFGLTKTLNLEWEKVFCRAIDISSNLKTQVAVDSIITELYDPNKFIHEVGYSFKGRVTLVGENDLINIKRCTIDATRSPNQWRILKQYLHRKISIGILIY